MNANKWARARIRVTIDGCDWLRYEDEKHEFVRMGDVVDVCADALGFDFNIHNYVFTGELRGVSYNVYGRIDQVFLYRGDRLGERWVDFDGCVYHHKEVANGTD